MFSPLVKIPRDIEIPRNIKVPCDIEIPRDIEIDRLKSYRGNKVEKFELWNI